MKRTQSPTSLIVGTALLAIVLGLVAFVWATNRATPAQASPASAPAARPAGDVVGMRSCGKLVVQKSPRLVVTHVRVAGTNCAHAGRLVHRAHKANEPAGRGIDARKTLQCEISDADNRIRCTKGTIRISFDPDCTDTACNV